MSRNKDFADSFVHFSNDFLSTFEAINSCSSVTSQAVISFSSSSSFSSFRSSSAPSFLAPKRFSNCCHNFPSRYPRLFNPGMTVSLTESASSTIHSFSATLSASQPRIFAVVGVKLRLASPSSSSSSSSSSSL